MKINKKIIKLLLLISILCFYSCGPESITYKYKFSARSDPFAQKNINILKKYKYSFELGNNEDELIEKNILFHVGQHLNSIGWEYTEDVNEAEILLSLKYSIRDTDKKFTKTVKKGSEQVVDTNWDGTAKKDKEGNIKYKTKNTYGTEERTRQGYLKEYNLRLSYGNEPIWSVDVSSFGKSYDLVEVSERLIPKILKKNFLKNGSKSGRYKFYVGCTDRDASNYCKKCEILDLEECKY